MTSLAAPRSIVGHSLGRLAAVLPRRLFRRWAARRAAADLSLLSDHALRDIGLSRDAFPGALRHAARPAF